MGGQLRECMHASVLCVQVTRADCHVRTLLSPLQSASNLLAQASNAGNDGRQHRSRTDREAAAAPAP